MIPGTIEVKIFAIIVLALMNLLLIKKNKKNTTKEIFQTIDPTQNKNFNIKANEGNIKSDSLNVDVQYNQYALENQTLKIKQNHEQVKSKQNERKNSLSQYLIGSIAMKSSSKFQNNQKGNSQKLVNEKQLNQNENFEPNSIKLQNDKLLQLNDLKEQLKNQDQLLTKQNIPEKSFENRTFFHISGPKNNSNNDECFMDIQQNQIQKQLIKSRFSESKSQPDYEKKSNQNQDDQLCELDRQTVELKFKKQQYCNCCRCKELVIKKDKSKVSLKRFFQKFMVQAIQEILEKEQECEPSIKKKKKASL